MQCNCGGIEEKHRVGEEACLREQVPVNPRPFPPFEDKWIMEDDVVITGTTLREQRGYHRHNDGNWSRPKDQGSENSIDA